MNRVLIVQTAFLGDVVLSQPLWAAVKRCWPRAEIDVLVQPQWAPLLAADPAIHEVLLFDKRKGDRGLAGLWRLAARLRGRNYDAAICPHPSFRSGLLLTMAGIPLRVGFNDSAGRLFYTHRLPRATGRHETARVLSLLSAWGKPVAAFTDPPRLTLHPQVIAQADEWLAEWGLPLTGKFACVHPGSVWATKRWLPEGFADVLSDLADDGLTPVILGGVGDIELANRVQDRVRILPVNLAGRLSLPELSLVLSRASLLVTNDSGPMHIAGAFGTPVVAVFGSTVPALGYTPVGSPSRIVEIEMPCRPCGPHGYQQCPLGHFHCMKHVTAPQVTAACREILASLPL